MNSSQDNRRAAHDDRDERLTAEVGTRRSRPAQPGVITRLEQRLTEMLTKLRTHAGALAKERTRVETEVTAAKSALTRLQQSRPRLADSLRQGLATVRLSLKIQAAMLTTERASIQSTLMLIERRLEKLRSR